LYSLGEHKYG